MQEMIGRQRCSPQGVLCIRKQNAFALVLLAAVTAAVIPAARMNVMQVLRKWAAELVGRGLCAAWGSSNAGSWTGVPFGSLCQCKRFSEAECIAIFRKVVQEGWRTADFKRKSI